MSHIEDRWTRPTGKIDKRKRPIREETERYGIGLRYLAQWTEQGKRKSKSFRTKDEASAHLHNIAKAQRDGTHVETHKRTVKDYGAEWLDAQGHVNPRTEKAMRSRWTNNIEPTLGHLRLRDVTKRNIHEAVRSWRDKDLSDATIHACFTYTNSMFSAAVKDRLIAFNPCEDVKIRSAGRGHVNPLTTAQVWEVATRVNPRYQALILLAAATGMRSGELRGISIDRIHYGEPTSIRVDRQLISTAPRWDDPKTKKSGRSITVDKHTVDVIDWHRYRVPPHASGLLFTGENGGPLHPGSISEVLRKIGIAMGLPPRFGLHAFRHYHASLLIAAGLSPTAVAARLGHSSPTLTLNIYSHLWRDDEDRSRAAIERGLFG